MIKPEHLSTFGGYITAERGSKLFYHGHKTMRGDSFLIRLRAITSQMCVLSIVNFEYVFQTCSNDIIMTSFQPSFLILGQSCWT